MEAPGPVQQRGDEGLTRAFLLALLSAVTEMERAMCLAGDALLGRRDTGAGKPVRLRSTPPAPAPWEEELLRALFMLQQEGALEAKHIRRSEGVGRAPSPAPRSPLQHTAP